MTLSQRTINAPGDQALDELCHQLTSLADALDAGGTWPAKQLALCANYGVYRWFLSEKWGGLAWNSPDIVRGYVRLAAACLTTAFILTQRQGACRRIESSQNDSLKHELLPPLASGDHFSTLGISHLTTSRRHLGKPCLTARESADGFVLEGYSPWVTGAAHADTVVLGATLTDGQEILVALPTKLPGVEVGEPAQLVALTASHTGMLYCREVFVERRWLLDGPVEGIMQRGSGGGTGGLATSALAVGLAQAAIDQLAREALRRDDLADAATCLQHEHDGLEEDLLTLAAGTAVCTLEDLRARANSLVLRATQAALTAAKGAGFVQGHPAGRWCREAMFFLVWSCPQAVAAANLCELSGWER